MNVVTKRHEVSLLSHDYDVLATSRTVSVDQ